MLSVELAQELRDAGLVWRPAPGDRFVLAHRGMDDEVFVVSDMTIEVHRFPTGPVIGFNGTTEWALDSVQLQDALWLPAEHQLRELLGHRFARLDHDPVRGFSVTVRAPDDASDDARAYRAPDSEQAYALALLDVLSPRSSPDCYSCRAAGDTDPPPRENILRTDRWRVVHNFETGLPGWLVLLPVRHVTSLADLNPAEAAELGPLIVNLSKALVAELGCLKTYVMQFAEAPGFAHVHFHMVPRAADLQPEVRGPRIFGALTGTITTDPAAAEEQDRLAQALTARLASIEG